MAYKHNGDASRDLDKKMEEAFYNNQLLFIIIEYLNDSNSFHNPHTSTNNKNNLSNFLCFNDNDILDMGAQVCIEFNHYFIQKNCCFRGRQEEENFESLLIHVDQFIIFFQYYHLFRFMIQNLCGCTLFLFKLLLVAFMNFYHPIFLKFSTFLEFFYQEMIFFDSN